MVVGDEKVCDTVSSFLQSNDLEFSIKEEAHCTHFYIKRGALKADLSVYTTGKIKNGVTDSPLRKFLEDAKEALSSANFGQLAKLPYEIEKFPQTIRERIPECDEVIIKFVNEAIRAYRADIPIATTFLLGAASEKAIFILIDSFGDAIGDEGNRKSFKERVGKKKVISAKYDEFMASYKACKTKCPDPAISNDLEVILNTMFHFYRITRNDVGHPYILPDIDKGVLLANLGQFVYYLERIYGLIRYFKENEMML
jgi:cob(I)alamin adenosyltransferase